MRNIKYGSGWRGKSRRKEPKECWKYELDENRDNGKMINAKGRNLWGKRIVIGKSKTIGPGENFSLKLLISTCQMVVLKAKITHTHTQIYIYKEVEKFKNSPDSKSEVKHFKEYKFHSL